MSFFASLSVIQCPICGEVVGVGGMRFGNEPELNTTTCENCKTELQITKDPVTGMMRAEKIKRN